MSGDKPMNVVVTGARGFVGRNLCAVLRERTDVRLYEHDVESPLEGLNTALRSADVVFHLAGVNRPRHVEEFASGNTGATRDLCATLESIGRHPKVVLTSSIQADRENPYGKSKLAAEEELRAYCERTGGEAIIYRLKNLFGKWCRPNYNSVTATFCHNVARGLPIQVNDPDAVVELTYIDDVVAAFVRELSAKEDRGCRFADVLPSSVITLANLARTIGSFRAHRETLVVPDFGDPFVRALYATYLSYLEPDQFSYGLRVNADQRGSLAEFVKSGPFGQIFVSRTLPGITRGNHYHHTKTEKFMVVEGEGLIRFRRIDGDEVLEYRVRGDEYRVVDIPPGYTHSIENVGRTEMVTLFWASEIFDPSAPDTFRSPVIR